MLNREFFKLKSQLVIKKNLRQAAMILIKRAVHFLNMLLKELRFQNGSK